MDEVMVIDPSRSVTDPVSGGGLGGQERPAQVDGEDAIPWDSPEQAQAWRTSAAFRDGVAKIREFLDGFESHTMDPSPRSPNKR
jgi:hypothetical protein